MKLYMDIIKNIFFRENYKDFTISFNHILEIILNKKGILCKKKQKEKSSNYFFEQ